MKPRKLSSETLTEPRRSSRIQEHATKRKTEDEQLEAAKKSKFSSEGKSLFSIFAKKESPPVITKTQTKRKSKQPKFRSSFEDTLPGLKSVTSQVKNEVIDIVDDHVSEPCKPAVEYNFVSVFVEHELAISCLSNHVQQFTEETQLLRACELSSALTPRNAIQENVLISNTANLRDINNYFSHNKDTFKSINGELVINPDNVESTVDEDGIVWVEKYKPKCVADIYCHSLGSQLLINWLREWKQKLKPTRNKTDSSNSGSSFDMSDEDDDMLKCVILAGRCGRGKTSAVYAVAQELGFKVFEINPSSSRVGRHILSQLQEATLSHHVEGLPKLSSFFGQIPKQDHRNSISNESTEDKKVLPVAKLTKLKPKPGAITNFFKKSDEDHSPETRKPKLVRKAEKKSSLLNFFKPQNKSISGTDDEKPTAEVEDKEQVFSVSRDEIIQDKVTCSKPVKAISLDDCSSNCSKQLQDNCTDTENSSSTEVTSKSSRDKTKDNNERHGGEVLVRQKHDRNSKHLDDNSDQIESAKLKFSSLSLILFDDADVYLELDEGFWSSINSFLKVTRKPVILTTSHNPEELCEFINSQFNVLDFDIMENDLACEYLKNVNAQENLLFTDGELYSLLKHCDYDLRQCILQMQFWASVKKSTSKPSDLYGISLPFLCLDGYAAENIFKWVFEWDVVQAAEVLFSLNLTNTCLLHNNVALWLPFKKISEKSKKQSNNTKPVKKYKRLDISWLSDEGSDDGAENVPDKVKSEDIASDTSLQVNMPSVLMSLECLSQLYDDFSEADVIFKCDYKSPKSFWLDEQKLLPKNEHSLSISAEISSWVNLLSAKHCRNELEKHPVEDICIYSDSLDTLNIGRTSVPDAKLVQCRQNISSGVLCLQRQNHADICLDYLSMLRNVCKCERERKDNNGKRSRRFLHYFESSGFTVEMEDLLEISKAFI